MDSTRAGTLASLGQTRHSAIKAFLFYRRDTFTLQRDKVFPKTLYNLSLSITSFSFHNSFALYSCPCFPFDFYARYAYNIIVRRLQHEIPGNRKNNISRWMAIQESKRFSLFLHPSNKTGQGHNPQPPRRHCSTNSQTNFQTGRAVKPGTAYSKGGAL